MNQRKVATLDDFLVRDYLIKILGEDAPDNGAYVPHTEEETEGP